MLPLPFLLFSLVGDLLGFTNRRFQSTDDFRRRFFAKIEVKNQLAFAIDATFTSAAKELLKELLDLQRQFDVLFFKPVVVGFELKDRVSLLFAVLALRDSSVACCFSSVACWRTCDFKSRSSDGKLRLPWGVNRSITSVHP